MTCTYRVFSSSDAVAEVLHSDADFHPTTAALSIPRLTGSPLLAVSFPLTSFKYASPVNVT